MWSVLIDNDERHNMELIQNEEEEIDDENNMIKNTLSKASVPITTRKSCENS